MGRVELDDGIAKRRIQVPDLHGVIRVDLTSSPTEVVVPESVAVERSSASDPPGE